jgi:hypothetical protein
VREGEGVEMRGRVMEDGGGVLVRGVKKTTKKERKDKE